MIYSGTSLSPYSGSRRGRVSFITRYIRTGNGSTTSAALNDPISGASGDTIEVLFVSPAGGVSQFLFGATATPASVEFDAADLLQLVGGTVTIDGAAVADGASVATYQDGEEHKLIFTFTASLSVDTIFQSGAASGFYGGQILTITYTPIATGVPLVYDLSNNSLTTQYAVGEASPSTKYITYTNFIASDIGLYTWDAVNVEWVGVELYTAGPAWAFDGTEPLFATISAEASTVGSVYRYRFILNNYTSGTVQHKPAGVITGNYVAITDVSGVVTAVSAAQVIKATVTPCIASGTWSVKHAIPRAY